MAGTNLDVTAGASGLEPVSPFSMGLLSSGEVWAADGLSLYVTRDDGSHWQLFHPPGIGGDLATSLTGFASAGTKDMWLGGITGRGFGTCAHPTVPARARLVFSYGSVDHTTDGAAAGPRPLCPNVVSQARSASPTPSTAAPSARRLVAARTRPGDAFTGRSTAAGAGRSAGALRRGAGHAVQR
jgi:hypothetical protein